jgi:virulence factor Mce-like protein
MSRQRRAHINRNRLFVILGVGAILVALTIGYISYTANTGLPWQRTYEIRAEVTNANRLIVTSDVRVGGTRVGQVQRITALSGSAGAQAPRARLTLALDRSLRPLPEDSEVRVRPASVLGATYVDLRLGHSDRKLADGQTLPLRAGNGTVELTDLLDIFDRGTAHSFRQTVAGLSYGLAGRGAALNSAIGSTSSLLRSVTHVTRALAARQTRLGRFISEYEATFGALRPVREQLAGAIGGGAATFDALARERGALAATIEVAPSAERATTVAFRRLRPGLDGLAHIAAALEPAGRLVPTALRNASSTLASGVTPLQRLPRFSERLTDALQALDTLSRDPATSGSLRKLRDVAVSLNDTLEVLLPAQLSCNIIGLWGQSFGGGFSALGTGEGPSLPALIVTTSGAKGETFQNSRPSSNVGINPLPNENASECESGNEPWDGKQQLNNPPGLQSPQTRDTVPPPGVRENAARAGLLGDPGSTR